MLTTIEIDQILSSNKYTKKTFCGTFSSNRLPRYLMETPRSMVVNIDPHFKPGSHWIAIHIDKYKTAHYFDSFGNPPSNVDILSFLNRNSKKGFVHNAIRFQSRNSTICGWYCILFLILQNKHKAYNKFYEILETKNPDKKILEIVKRLRLKTK